MEILSRAELDKEINRKVRATVRMAYDHNQFFHELFRNSGINPYYDIEGKDDLLKAYKKGVRMEGTDIPRAYPDYVNEIYTEVLWTSGSTGRPKQILYSKDDIERSNKQSLQIWKSIGVMKGAKVLNFLAPWPFPTSLIIPSSARELEVQTLNYLLPSITPNTPKKDLEFIANSLIRMINGFDPNHIVGGTWTLYGLPQFLEPYGFDAKKLNVKSVLFGAEPSTPERRKRIGELWNAEPFELWASGEASVMGYECNLHNGLHINEPETFITAVDPENYEEVGENEEGIDLVTVLYEEGKRPGTFFINYTHGDIIKLLGKCSCGCTFKLVSYPRRDSERIRIAGFGLDVRDIESLIVSPPYTGEYVGIYGVDPVTNRYKLTIRVEVKGKPAHTLEDFKYALLASNPQALGLFESNVIFDVEFTELGKLYRGYEQYVRPGKPTRIIKLEIDKQV
jgi:phenylacetate-CoA ligase